MSEYHVEIIHPDDMDKGKLTPDSIALDVELAMLLQDDAGSGSHDEANV